MRILSLNFNVFRVRYNGDSRLPVGVRSSVCIRIAMLFPAVLIVLAISAVAIPEAPSSLFLRVSGVVRFFIY